MCSFSKLGQGHHKNLHDSSNNVFDGMKIKLLKQVKKIIDHLLNWRILLNYGLLLGLLVGLGFSIEQIWLNFISKSSSFKVDFEKIPTVPVRVWTEKQVYICHISIIAAKNSLKSKISLS